MKDFLLNYLRFYLAIPNGYTRKDKILILLNCLLRVTYPVSVLTQRLIGRSLNLWGFVSQYTFRYRNYRFLSPAELSAMMSLESSEPSVKAILERSQSGDAVDVGANFGFYSVILSHSVRPDRKVVSIEPDPVYFGYLEKNVSLNGCV